MGWGRTGRAGVLYLDDNAIAAARNHGVNNATEDLGEGDADELQVAHRLYAVFQHALLVAGRTEEAAEVHPVPAGPMACPLHELPRD